MFETKHMIVLVGEIWFLVRQCLGQRWPRVR